MKLIGSPAQDVRHAQYVVCETQRQQGVSYRHEGAAPGRREVRRLPSAT